MRPMLFVYGTLKRGHPAHDILKDCILEADFARMHATMYALGGYPGLKLHTGNDSTVAGELYSFPEDESEYKRILDALDNYEGVPNLYRRELRYAYTDGAAHPAWTYIYNYEVKPEWLIESGVW